MVWMELAQHLATAVSFELSGVMTSSLVAIGAWQDAGHSLVSQLGGDWSQMGSQIESHLAVLFNTDVFAATRSFFDHFFKTGQAWALLIGIVVGYLLRGLTSYG